MLPGAALLSGVTRLTRALRPELARLAPPTLLLWGDKDAFGAPQLGHEMAALMPHGRCEEVADAGHLPWLDQPDRCAEAITKFLA